MAETFVFLNTSFFIKHRLIELFCLGVIYEFSILLSLNAFLEYRVLKQNFEG